MWWNKSLIKVSFVITMSSWISMADGLYSNLSVMNLGNSNMEISAIQNTPSNQFSDPMLKEMHNGLELFSLKVFKRLMETHGNIVFSPVSVTEGIAMPFLGAVGDTEKEFYSMLHVNADKSALHHALGNIGASFNSNPSCGVSFANSIWVDKKTKILESFQEKLSADYKTKVKDFNAMNTKETSKLLNDWIRKSTNNKIKNLVKPSDINHLTAVMLINAIAFKGKWYYTFNKSNTKRLEFRLNDGKTKKVSIMSNKNTYAYAETDELQILEMKYCNCNLSFIVLLPRKPDGLGSLERSLTQENLEKWLNLLQEEQVEVFLPKLSINYSLPMENCLRALGLKKAFTAAAEFSGISNETLRIDRVLHGAQLELDEEEQKQQQPRLSPWLDCQYLCLRFLKQTIHFFL